MRHLIFYGILLLAMVGSVQALSYDYLNNNTILHFNNSYDEYYINLSSGIQLTNVYPDFWAQNIWCAQYSFGASGEQICNDAVAMSMSVVSDNSTFINVSGIRDVVVSNGGKQYKFRFILLYHLEENDTNLSIFMSGKNTGVNNFTGSTTFKWKITNIKISNNKTDDFLYINRTYFMLNTSFNKTYTNLSEQIIYLGDAVTGNNLWLFWNSTNYSVNTDNTTETLNIPFKGLIVNQTKGITLNWLDALCNWNTNLNFPNATVNITVGQTFLIEDGFTFLGSCPFGGTHTVQYYNGTAYETIPLTTTKAFSVDLDNPYSFGRFESTVDWTTTSRLVINSAVRIQTTFNAVTRYTTEQTVIVNAVPAGSNCTGYTALSVNTNLSTNSNLCYNITSDNIYLDCKGYNITGNQYLSDAMIKGSNHNNISIYNCYIYNNPNAIYLNNITGIMIINITHLNSGLVIGAVQYPTSLNLIKVLNATIKNITFKDSLFNNSVLSCAQLGGSSLIVNLSYSSNVSLYNITQRNISQWIGQNVGGESCVAGYGQSSKFINIYYTNNSILKDYSSNNTESNILTCSSCQNIIIQNGYLESIKLGTGIKIDTNSNNASVYNLTLNGNSSAISCSTSGSKLNLITIENVSAYGGMQNSSYTLGLSNAENSTIKNINISMPMKIAVGTTSTNILVDGIFNTGLINYVISGTQGFLAIESTNTTIKNVNLSNISMEGSDTTRGVIFATGTNGLLIYNVSLRNINGNGIVLYGGVGAIVANSTVTNTTLSDIYIYQHSQVVLQDVVFNKSKMGFQQYNNNWRTNVSYSARVNVTNPNGTGAIAGIQTFDVRNTSYLNFTTNSSGLSDYQLFLEYIQNGTSSVANPCVNTTNVTCYSPYNFTANYSSHYSVNSTILNVSAPLLQANIGMNFCAPTLVLWTLNNTCYIDNQVYTSSVNFNNAKNASLIATNSTLYFKNMTWIGNITLTNSSIQWGFP